MEQQQKEENVIYGEIGTKEKRKKRRDKIYMIRKR